MLRVVAIITVASVSPLIGSTASGEGGLGHLRPPVAIPRNDNVLRRVETLPTSPNQTLRFALAQAPRQQPPEPTPSQPTPSSHTTSQAPSQPSPVTAKPVTAKPVTAKPVTAKPVAAKPVAAKPATATRPTSTDGVEPSAAYPRQHGDDWRDAVDLFRHPTSASEAAAAD